VAKNNKTCLFYVLHSDKTWVFDQSERVQGPIDIIICNMTWQVKVMLKTTNSNAQ